MFPHQTSINEDIWLFQLWLRSGFGKRTKRHESLFTDRSQFAKKPRRILVCSSLDFGNEIHKLKLKFRLIIISIKAVLPNCNSTEMHLHKLNMISNRKCRNERNTFYGGLKRGREEDDQKKRKKNFQFAIFAMASWIFPIRSKCFLSFINILCLFVLFSLFFC